MKKINSLDCILLVDDNEATLFLHQLIIKKLKLDVFVQEAYNGVEALEFLTCTGKFAEKQTYPQPGIILLDINMPLMNGWEFLDEYNKLPEGQKGDIVIVMLTSSMSEADIDRAKANPDMKGFISKPLRLENLQEIIEEHFLAENIG